MANISISNLHPVGADLFDTSESYLQDLMDAEIIEANGGLIFLTVTTSYYASAFTAGLLSGAIYSYFE
jgi:hypothetical protein